MIRIRGVVLALTALLFAGVLTACGSSSSSGGSQSVTPGSGSSASASGPQQVMIKGFAFHPSSLTVKVGTKVTFTNEDTVTHTATTTGSKTINSSNLTKGQSYTVTFTKAGTYAYICEIHQYMKGTITVT
jgi:plastocyanin